MRIETIEGIPLETPVRSMNKSKLMQVSLVIVRAHGSGLRQPAGPLRFAAPRWDYRVPEGAGFGLELDEDLIVNYRLDR